MSSSAKNENTPIIPPDSIFISWSLPFRKQTRQILSEALCIFGRKIMLSPPRMMAFMFHQQRQKSSSFQHPDILWILLRSSIASASLFLKETILCFILIIKKLWILSLREPRRILSAGSVHFCEETNVSLSGQSQTLFSPLQI